MSEKGECFLSLFDADSKPWRGEAFIRVESDREEVIFRKRRTYLHPIKFDGLWTVPRGPYVFHVKTEHHVPMSRYVNVFSQRENEVAMKLVVHYKAADAFGQYIRYPAFADLRTAGLGEVEEVLLNGPDQPHFQFADAKEYPVRDVSGRQYYDGLVKNKAQDGNHRLLGCLFNLYAKMKDTVVPGPASLNAWKLIHSIFSFRQDRLFATVDPNIDMSTYLAALDESLNFEKNDSRNHNIPSPEGYAKSERTYKTKDKEGNLQLTFASKDVGGGQKEWIVDVDIDEKSGIAHWIEAGYHLFAGGRTNPYAVHQLLALAGHRPSYDLVLAAPAAAMVA